MSEKIRQTNQPSFILQKEENEILFQLTGTKCVVGKKNYKTLKTQNNIKKWPKGAGECSSSTFHGGSPVI